MNALLAVAAGGAAGPVARYPVVLFCARLSGPPFPCGALTVTVVGSLAERGEFSSAAAYVPASVAFSVGGLFIGLKAAPWLA